MLIKVLDRAAMGLDTPLEPLYKLGEVVTYDFTNKAELAERISDADVIIINKIKITREVMLSAKKLRLICLFATGYDNVDVRAASELGIAVCNVPGYSTDSVAQITVATVLSLVSHLPLYSGYVKSGKYTASGRANLLEPTYHEIRGKTWGIIGYGNIGRAVGRVAEALGAKVIVNKRTPDPEAENADIHRICTDSDIITIHCPLTAQTRGLINKERISIMKSGVVIVNAARGAVVNESDVADAVLDGKIAAFGSDVYSDEPIGAEHPFNKIKALDNVILTPHMAWGAFEARARCVDIISENISDFIDGKIRNRVDI